MGHHDDLEPLDGITRQGDTEWWNLATRLRKATDPEPLDFGEGALLSAAEPTGIPFDPRA